MGENQSVQNTEQLEKELRILAAQLSDNWTIQNNALDKRTNYIYRIDSLDELFAEVEKREVDNRVKDYALHRWYNFKASVACEYIFCEFGAVHENDPYNHDVDIYINGDPFDVKLTVYPAALSDRPFDLSSEAGKDEMITWLYNHQSKQSRHQWVNRLYVVCDAPTVKEKNLLKCNFGLMRERISDFMKKTGDKCFQYKDIPEEDNKDVLHRLKSELILID